jgi:HAD superfamily hydrolase (TIGR01459 family)
MPTVPLIRGLREIAPDYDALIVDLWGVVHGGIEPYPEVLDTLAALRAAGKPVGLLSNAPRRSHLVAARLAEIGVPPGAYDRLMTSGEAAHEALAERSGAHAGLGRRYLYVGPHWDTDLAEGLDYRRVDSVEDADFLLTVGLFDEADPLDAYDAMFARACARDLAMLCVNPDLVVHRQSGVTSPCAGLLAQRYEGQGGRVIYHGKPDPAVFRRLAQDLGAADGRVLVVGDSLTTDIKGAVAAGYDSLWVTRGIYAAELGIAPGDAPDPAKVLEVCERHGHWPTTAIASFRW